MEIVDTFRLVNRRVRSSCQDAVIDEHLTELSKFLMDPRLDALGEIRFEVVHYHPNSVSK